MEDDSGRVTRSRRRLSVEQDSKHEDSPMNTPTKKRTGRMSLKPQLDNIVENEAAPIRSPRRGGRKSLAPVEEPLRVVEEDPVSTVTRGKSAVVAAASVTDSPKPGKRITRRQSVTGGETETAAPLTPLRRSRRISVEFNNVVAEETIAETKTVKSAKKLKEIEPLIEEHEKENTDNNTTLNNSFSKREARLSESILQKSGSTDSPNDSTNKKRLSLNKSATKNQGNSIEGIGAVTSDDSEKNSKSPSALQVNHPKSDDSPSRRSPRISAKIETSQNENFACSSESATTPHSKTSKDMPVTISSSENKHRRKSRTKSTSNFDDSVSEISKQSTTERSQDDLIGIILGGPGPRVSLVKAPLDNSGILIKEGKFSTTEKESPKNKFQHLQDNSFQIEACHDKSESKKSMNITEPLITFENTNEKTKEEFKKSFNESHNKTETSFNNTVSVDSRISNKSELVGSERSLNRSKRRNAGSNKSEDGEFETVDNVEKASKTLNSPLKGIVDVKDNVDSVISYMEVDEDMPEEICTENNMESICDKSTSLNLSEVKMGTSVFIQDNHTDPSQKSEKLDDSVNELNNYRKIKYEKKDKSNSKCSTSKSMEMSILLDDPNEDMDAEEPNDGNITTDEKKASIKLHKDSKISKSLQALNSRGKATKKNISFEELSKNTPTRIKQLKKLGLHTSTPILSQNAKGVESKSSSESKLVISKNESEHSDDSDDITNKLYLNDEAEDAGMDYQSGDSLDEDEAEVMRCGEIEHKGETLGSDTDEESDVSEYEKGSFIVTSDEEEEELLSGNGDNLSLTDEELTQSTKSKKKYNEKKIKEQKKASQEMYAARHSKDIGSSSKLESDSDTEIVIQKSNKKRNRIESEGKEEEEITCLNDSFDKSLKDPLSASVVVKVEPNSPLNKDVSTNSPAAKSDESKIQETEKGEVGKNQYIFGSKNQSRDSSSNTKHPDSEADEPGDSSTDEDSRKIVDTYNILLNNLNETPPVSDKSTNILDTSKKGSKSSSFAISGKDTSLMKNIIIASKSGSDKLENVEPEEVQVNENESMFVNMDLSRDPFSNTNHKYEDSEDSDTSDDGQNKSTNSESASKERTSGRKPSLSGSFNKSAKSASISIVGSKEDSASEEQLDIVSNKVRRSSISSNVLMECDDDLGADDGLVKNNEPVKSVSAKSENKSCTSTNLTEQSSYDDHSINSDTSVSHELSSRSFKNALDYFKNKTSPNVLVGISHPASNGSNISSVEDNIVTNSPRVNESIRSTSNSDSNRKKKKKNVSFSLEANDSAIIDFVNEIKVSNDSLVEPSVSENTLPVNESVLHNSDSAKKKKKNNSISMPMNSSKSEKTNVVSRVGIEDNDENKSLNESSLNLGGKKKRTSNSFSMDKNYTTENSDIAAINSPSSNSVSKKSSNSFIETSVNSDTPTSNLDSAKTNKKRNSFESNILATSPSIVSSKICYTDESAHNKSKDLENMPAETTIGIQSSHKKSKKNKNVGSDSSLQKGNTLAAGFFDVSLNSTHEPLIPMNGESSAKKNKKSRADSAQANVSGQSHSANNSLNASTVKVICSKKLDSTLPEDSAFEGPLLTSTGKKKLKQQHQDSSLYAETHKGNDASIVLIPEFKMHDISHQSNVGAETSKSKKKKKVKSCNVSLSHESGSGQATELLTAEDHDKSASPCYSESLNESKQKRKKKKKREREQENVELQSTEAQEIDLDVFPVDADELSHQKKKMKYTKSVEDLAAKEHGEENQSSKRSKKRKATDELTKETFKTETKDNSGIRRLPAAIIEQLRPASKKSRTDFAVEPTSKRKAKPSAHLDQSILVKGSPTCVGKTGQFVTVKKKKIMPSVPLVSASNFGATTQFNVVPLSKRPKNELRMDNLQFHMGSNFKEEALANRKRISSQELIRKQRNQFARGRILRR